MYINDNRNDIPVQDFENSWHNSFNFIHQSGRIIEKINTGEMKC